jgi:endonuclease-3
MPTVTDREAQAALVIRRLRGEYPDAHIVLRFSNDWELLVCVMLSAQTTDVTVNKVTANLFNKYRTVADYAGADLAEFEQDIHSTGFFHNKAKHVIASAQKILADYGGAVPASMQELLTLPGVARKTANILISAAKRIMETYGGKVPGTMEELTSLAGVARKTANIVLANAYPEAYAADPDSGIAVDTHVNRLSQRLGLAASKDSEKIERELMEVVPRDDWFEFTYLLIEHGRAVCDAKRPRCGDCLLNDICPSAFEV